MARWTTRSPARTSSSAPRRTPGGDLRPRHRRATGVRHLPDRRRHGRSRGAFRSLRSVPQYREIAATVREQCPDAWVFNYTNPMTVCTRTLYEEYPDINAIGLCHEVTHVQHMLADVAERHIDAAEDVSGSEIAVNVKGINHFTWIDEVRWRGHDVFQYLDDELERHKPFPGFEPANWRTSPTGATTTRSPSTCTTASACSPPPATATSRSSSRGTSTWIPPPRSNGGGSA
ncbi:hypothetical protein ACFQL4_19845 [Halosimplex aquaticum]